MELVFDGTFGLVNFGGFKKLRPNGLSLAHNGRFWVMLKILDFPQFNSFFGLIMVVFRLY